MLLIHRLTELQLRLIDMGRTTLHEYDKTSTRNRWGRGSWEPHVWTITVWWTRSDLS